MKRNPVDEYVGLMGSIRNAAHCIMEYASNHGDKGPDEITWTDVESMNKVYADLLEIARFCNITVKEV